MKQLNLLILGIVLSFNIALAQENSNWNILQHTEQFEIAARKVNCTDASKGISKEYLFLKISNKTNETIALEYKLEKWYDGVCSNCDAGAENGLYKLEIEANKNMQATCENYRDRKLAVFSKMTGNTKARKLSNFKFIPLAVNNIKIN